MSTIRIYAKQYYWLLYLGFGVLVVNFKLHYLMIPFGVFSGFFFLLKRERNLLNVSASVFSFLIAIFFLLCYFDLGVINLVAGLATCVWSFFFVFLYIKKHMRRKVGEKK